MFIKILANYVSGFLRIRAEGFFIERFINLCINKGIFLWNIKREKFTVVHANISIKDFKRLRQIIKKTNTKINIETKKGIPIIMHKYRKRKAFIGFLLIIILMLFINSKFIWNIEITGISKISESDIMQTLESEGLEIGILKKDIDVNSIINKVRLKRDDIAWIGIKIKGTNAIVEIKETTEAPIVIDENEVCNIIANKSGIITKMIVQKGTGLAQVGDTVNEGDLLVGGYVEGEYTDTRYVHALADVEAKVIYSKKEKVFLSQQIQVSSGESEKKYTVNVKKLKINLYKTLSKFENYDTISESKKLKLFSNFYLPIEITKTTNYEYIYETVTYTEEELKSITIEKFEKELEEEIGDKTIVDKSINVEKGEGYLEIEVIYEVLENIGKESK